MKSKEPINHPNNTPPSWCNMSCSYYPTCRKDHEAACDTVKALSKDRSKKSANDVLPDDIFLSLLNTAVQEKCEAKEVSDYILASNELLLAVETPGTELHIITNELDNYDKTVLASMAISANILGLRQVEGDVYCPATNGVKYIYYCPSECVESFSKFKVRIANFARRDPSSRREVDGWLRRNFSRRNRLMKKLMQLNGKSPEDFVNTLLDGICKIDGFCNGKVVDIGGGFTSSMLDQMVSYIRQQGNYDHLNLLVEPGRYLLNPCIDMIVKIIDIRYKHGKKLVFIDSGIYDGLLDVIIKNKRFEIDIVRQHKNTIPTSDCILCGYSSDISDVIGIYSLPDDLTIGEKLRIQNCGAYCSELETKFCNNKKVNYRVDF